MKVLVNIDLEEHYINKIHAVSEDVEVICCRSENEVFQVMPEVEIVIEGFNWDMFRGCRQAVQG